MLIPSLITQTQSTPNRLLSSPEIVKDLDDVTVLPSQNFQFTLQEVFEDPEADPLTYSASLEDGDSLPDWIQFQENGDNLTFSGVAPPEWSNYSVKITAADESAEVSGVFKIVIPDTAPELMYSIEEFYSSVNKPFI